MKSTLLGSNCIDGNPWLIYRSPSKMSVWKDDVQEFMGLKKKKNTISLKSIPWIMLQKAVGYRVEIHLIYSAWANFPVHFVELLVARICWKKAFLNRDIFKPSESSGSWTVANAFKFHIFKFAKSFLPSFVIIKQFSNWWYTYPPEKYELVRLDHHPNYWGK